MPINITNVELAVTAGLKSQFPNDGLMQIALSGRSNVGKSSLLNKLVGRKSLARVSGMPGKTITLNFYRVDALVGRKIQFYIVDLPGYGFAKRAREDAEKWSMLTDSYFNSGGMAGVAQLIDLKVGPTADDEMMLEFLNVKNIPYFIVATKVDKLNKTEREAAMAALRSNELISPETKIIPFSALKGEGTDECLSEILSLIGV
jgi:GTP-binding protein